MSVDFTGRWFVLYVRNKQERRVREELPYESVVPMIEEKKVTHDPKTDEKVVSVEMVPKYPNYVFVKHDGTPGFFERCLVHHDVVSFAGGLFNEAEGRYPQPISDDEAENMFKTELARNLEKSARVKVVDGPYRDQVGKIVDSARGKCLVEIKVFNLAVKEWIPEEFLINE